MSGCEPRPNDELAFRLAEICEEAVSSGDLESLSMHALAGVTTSLLRLLAARAQSHLDVTISTGNNRLSATDAAIAATLVLESVPIEVFELAAWQSLTNIGTNKRIKSTEDGKELAK